MSGIADALHALVETARAVLGWLALGLVGGAAFYAIVAAAYWFLTYEVVGTTALALTGGLSFLIGFYVLFTGKRVGVRPEDRLDGEQFEADVDYGFFPPHSWWPWFAAQTPTSNGLRTLPTDFMLAAWHWPQKLP